MIYVGLILCLTVIPYYINKIVSRKVARDVADNASRIH